MASELTLEQKTWRQLECAANSAGGIEVAIVSLPIARVKALVEGRNTRPAPAEDEVTIPRNPTEAMMDAGLYHCSHDMEWSDLFTAWQAMFDAVTLDGGMTEHAKASPAPAATDTGLKTIGFVPPMFVEGKGADYNDIFRSVSIAENYTAVVTRSQAEELLAAKDRDHASTKRRMQKLVNDVEAEWQRCCDELKADNAAKDARIKELDRCHEGTIDLCNQKTAQIETLEAKLAAALEAHKSLFGDKTMEGILWPDAKPTDLITIRVQKQIYDKARAVLGGKPLCLD